MTTSSEIVRVSENLLCSPGRVVQEMHSLAVLQLPKLKSPGKSIDCLSIHICKTFKNSKRLQCLKKVNCVNPLVVM